MKKLIVAALALLVLLSIPGAEAADYAEGNHKFGFICNGFDNETFGNMLETFKVLGDEDGITVLGGEHHADANKLFEEAEAMIAAGVDILMFQNFDPAGTEEIVREWKSRGVMIISYGEKSQSADANVLFAQYDLGFMIGAMAARWINEKLADQDRVEVYIHGHVYESLGLRADGIEAALQELCPAAVIVDRGNVLGAKEPDTFEKALVLHPDIQVVCSINDTSCISICEWWISELKANGADLSRYAGFSIDATYTGLALIAASRSDESIFRGTLDGKLGEFMGDSTVDIWEMVRKLYEEGAAEDYSANYSEVTAQNIAEYGY